MIYYILGINILTFIIYGIDKLKAKKNKWRVPEKTLLLLALVGGSVGAFLAMRAFHHKTKHWQFTIGVPVMFILQVAAYLWWIGWI